MAAWAAALRRWFAAAPRALLVAGAVAAAIALGAAICIPLVGGSRAALFATPLHTEQLDEVEQRLAEWNVPFTPLPDNVLVDARIRSAILLRLSFSGVPHAHIESSSDMLAKVGALTPQSIIDEQKRAALAADLELALRGIEGVQDASVIIAPAKPAIYADEETREATASVRLRLRAGIRLPASAVAGIRAFVAAGVPGLDAKRVTIVDDRGVALDDQAEGLDGESLQASVQSALDEAFGAGISIVRVHVEHSSRPGQSKGDRLSIAVAVDDRRSHEVDQIRSLAAGAAGFDGRRGDVIGVEAVHFRRNGPGRKTVWLGLVGSALAALPTLIACVAFLIAMRIGVRPALTVIKTLVRGARVVRTQRAVSAFAPTQVRGVLKDEPPHTAAAIISALPAATAAAVLDMYPADERAAIVRRMSRAHSPLVPDVETMIANA